MEPLINRSIRHWWVFILRGILFILLGIYMIASPAGSLAALGFLFGIVVLLTGIAELFRIASDRGHSMWVWHLVLGIIDVLLGILLLGHLAASEVILSIMVGIWFLFRGFSLLSFSSVGGRSWLITFGAIITILLGLIILFNPLFGALAIVLWVSIAFIVMGIFNLLLGFRLKG